MATRKKVSKAGQKRVGAKISHLTRKGEGVSPKQRIAIALAMERRGQLGPRGGFTRSKKKAG
jgi:hypothetical protein